MFLRLVSGSKGFVLCNKMQEALGNVSRKWKPRLQNPRQPRNELQLDMHSYGQLWQQGSRHQSFGSVSVDP